MSLDAIRALERAHGILAWLATAAIVLAFLALLRARAHLRLALLLGLLATALATITGALGLQLDDPYRSRLRQKLFVKSASLGWLFERKEHFAFGAILLAFAGIASLGAAWAIGARRSAASAEPLTRELRRGATAAWAASALLAIAASVASAVVARHARF